MNEQLSAFLDNEATRDESDAVVSALLRDERLRESWTRQHWVRTTLRAHSAEAAVAVDAAFSSRVMQAIAADDNSRVTPPVRAKVLTVARRKSARRWRSVAGAAAAASVAGVVLLAGNPLSRDSNHERRDTQSRVALARADDPAPPSARQASKKQGFDGGHWNGRLADVGSVSAPSASVRTVSAGRVAPASARAGVGSRPADMRTSDEAAQDHWSVSDPAVRDELNGYLADHNGMAQSYGMPSTTSALVRVATYGQGAAQ